MPIAHRSLIAFPPRRKNDDLRIQRRGADTRVKAAQLLLAFSSAGGQTCLAGPPPSTSGIIGPRYRALTLARSPLESGYCGPLGRGRPRARLGSPTTQSRLPLGIRRPPKPISARPVAPFAVKVGTFSFYQTRPP